MAAEWVLLAAWDGEQGKWEARVVRRGAARRQPRGDGEVRGGGLPGDDSGDGAAAL
jgi:hypothetical protein